MQYLRAFLCAVLVGFAGVETGWGQQVDSTVLAVADTVRPVVADTVVTGREVAPRVFLDCDQCDWMYLRQEITFVNYVRDPELADVHIFVTQQMTGSGGITYTLNNKGLKEFSGIDNTITYTATQDLTYDERRKGLTDIIKLSLVPYVARTPLASRLAVSYREDKRAPRQAARDPWNYWIFDIDGSGSYNAEKSSSFYAFNLSVSANRVTEGFKTTSNLYNNQNQRVFKKDDGSKKITNQYNRGYQGALVKSLTGHWSAGVFYNLSSTSFRNMQLAVGLTPAIEYNVFPYSQSSRKELTISYRIGNTYRKYLEETIYGKKQEGLHSQSLWINLRVRQPWGFVFAGVSGSHYLHDFSKNNIDFSTNVSFRLARGLSLRLNGGYSIVHDQLYLAKGEVSDEDLYLQQRALATSYELSGSVGIAYSFGSIYNNVVNTRL